MSEVLSRNTIIIKVLEVLGGQVRVESARGIEYLSVSRFGDVPRVGTQFLLRENIETLDTTFETVPGMSPLKRPAGKEWMALYGLSNEQEIRTAFGEDLKEFFSCAVAESPEENSAWGIRLWRKAPTRDVVDKSCRIWGFLGVSGEADGGIVLLFKKATVQ